MINISTKRVSFISICLIIASAVTAAILPSKTTISKGERAGRNGRLYYEDNIYGDVTCIEIMSASFYTCHDTASNTWGDPSGTSGNIDFTSYDNCGWCGENTTGQDMITGDDSFCF